MRISEMCQEIKAEFGKGVNGVVTGFRSLDEMLLGFQAGDYVVVGGRPSVGKTAFLTDLMLAAIRSGTETAYFSLEMSQRVSAMRTICNMASVGMHGARLNGVTKEEELRLDACLQDPMFDYLDFHYTTSYSPGKLNQYLTDHKPRIVFLDYMQLMRLEQHTRNRVEEVALISKGLSNLAKVHDITIVAAAQLNRTADESEWPRMSQLRECGNVEQDADVILLLYNPSYYNQLKAKDDNDKQPSIIVAKQRNGPVGNIEVSYMPHLMSWRERAFTEEF